MGDQKPISMEISRVVGCFGPQRACWLVLGRVFPLVVSPAADVASCVRLGALSRSVSAFFHSGWFPLPRATLEGLIALIL